MCVSTRLQFMWLTCAEGDVTILLKSAVTHLELHLLETFGQSSEYMIIYKYCL